MKKTLFLIAAVACMALAACNKEEPKHDPVVVYDNVSFSSFGFTAQDNPEVLGMDIIVEAPKSGKIEFALPFGTDENVLKALIPSFELNPGKDKAPEAKVMVGETEYAAGTPVDFSKTVDFIITNGDKNSLYSVSVSIKNAPAWTLAATSDSTFYSTPFMAVNPVDDLPYVSGILNADSNADRYPIAYKVADGKFSGLTKGGVIVQNRADNTVVAFDPSGNVYAHFLDYVNGSSATLLRSSVVAFDNGSAKFLGNAADLPAVGANAALFPFASNNIWTAFNVKNSTDGLTKRLLSLSSFNGSSWTNKLSINGRPASNYGYMTFAASRDGLNYLLVYNQNVQTISLYSFVNNNWTTIFEDLIINKADGSTPETHPINLRSMDLAIDSEGNPYIMVIYQYSSDTYNPGVIKYDIEAKTQTLVGGAVNLDGEDLRYFSIALSPTNVLYMAYQNADKKPAVMYIDSKTKAWSTPTVLDGCNLNGIYAPTIRFNKKGVGFIAAKDTDSAKCVLYSTTE